MSASGDETLQDQDSRLFAVVAGRHATHAHPGARIAARRSARAALACLLLLTAAPAGAWSWSWDETQPALRLSLGLDVYHAPGTMVAAARYGGSWNVKAGAWVRDVHVQPEAPNYLLGAGYVLTKSRWRLGAGVVWIDEDNDVNGTRWNFDASVAYDLSERVFLEYQHFSHGAILGLKKDSSNGGWNLFSVGLIF
ncbi:MAG TPA: hypothetical protein VLV56_09220 [Burkholderiales bacterium]|nr:hypothetical protein [Burkholderiales bacterium]